MAFKEGDEKEIFESCELLGGRILSEEEKTACDEAAIKAITHFMNYGTLVGLTASERRMAVLSMVDKLKSRQNRDMGFWEFLSSSYACDKFDQTTENALRELVFTVLTKEHKKIFFVARRDSQERRLFASTLSLHAFSPKEQWFDILDLVEGLFCEDLNYTYSEDDPRLDSLFTRLFRMFPLFSSADVTDEGGSSDTVERIETDARSYRVYRAFQRLALEKRECAVTLLKDMLQRIAILYDGKQLSEDTYEDVLCREWSERDVKERKKPSSKDDVATSFQPRFRLKNGRCVEIFVSDTYLEQSDFESLKYVLYYGAEKKAEDYTGRYKKGFTWVMIGFEVELKNFRSESDFKRIRLEIYADDKKIYDSGSVLYRNYFVFSFKGEEKREPGLGSYIFVVPEDADLLGDENVSTSRDDRFNQRTLAAYSVTLSAGCVVSLDGKTIFADGDRDMDVRILRSAGSNLPIGSHFVKESEEYALVSSGRSIVIDAKNEVVRNLRIEKNGTHVNLAALKGARGDARTRFELPMDGFDDAVVSYLGQRFCFLSVTNASWSFDRDFYFLSEDYEGAKLEIDLDGLDAIAHFAQSDEYAVVPDGRLGGRFLVSVPKVRLRETKRLFLDERPALFWRDISQSACLSMTVPQGLPACPDIWVRIGDERFDFDKNGVLEIGNAIYFRLGEGDRQDVEIVAAWSDEDKTERSYALKTVFYKDGFLNPPAVTYGDGALHIDGMEGYVGDEKSVLRIVFWKSVESNRKNARGVEFGRDTSEIFVGKLDDGYYSYEIVSFSSRVEDGSRERTIASGNFQTGDEDEFRFKSKRLVVTPIIEGPHGYGTIFSCYIDNPKFAGREDTPDGECPIYYGALYEYQPNLMPRYFSDAEKKGRNGEKIYKVNPVKIAYIKEGKLSITTQGGDGLYYVSEGYGKQCVARITDIEPDAVNEDRYGIADYFQYTANRGK